MKFLSAITDQILGYRTSPPPLTYYKESEVPQPLGALKPKYAAIRFEVTLRADLTGPVDEMSQLRQRAAQMFAHELYSDVLHELRELRRELYTEPVYRDANDPVLRRLYALESKLKGEM